MNYKLAFVYNLLKISLRKKLQPVQINKESTKQPLVKEQSEPQLFNKRRPKIDYP
jgi:hypothetical protein